LPADAANIIDAERIRPIENLQSDWQSQLPSMIGPYPNITLSRANMLLRNVVTPRSWEHRSDHSEGLEQVLSAQGP